MWCVRIDNKGNNSISIQILFNINFSSCQLKCDSWLFLNQFDFNYDWTNLKLFLHPLMFNRWNYKYLFIIKEIVFQNIFMIYIYSKFSMFTPIGQGVLSSGVHLFVCLSVCLSCCPPVQIMDNSISLSHHLHVKSLIPMYWFKGI